LHEKFPSFHGRVNGDRLACRGKLQPTELSPLYKVDVAYRYGDDPKVWVVEPEIPYERAIHMYADASLCLYDWREQPWKESYHLYDTVLPWAAEWLLYYEIYKLTGKWIGTSALHGTPKQEPEVSDE
jgi:hypothetical protein